MNELLEAMNDPRFRHAAMVHMPVALSALALLAGVVALLGSWKINSLRWIAVAAYALLAVSAYFASESGSDAEGEIAHAMPAEAAAKLTEHEDHGRKIWWMGAGVAVLFTLSAFKKNIMRLGMPVLGVAGGAGLAYFVAHTGHLGGELVYDYGVGTPQPVRDTSGPSLPSADPVGNDAGEDGEGGGDDEGTDDGDDAGAASTPDPKLVFFVEEVYPILEAACHKCHNPNRLKGEFDMTTHAAMLTGGDTGAAIVPGDAEGSLLFQRIIAEDELDLMPPDVEKRLSEEQVEIIRTWIDDGAAWPEAETP